MNINRKVKLRKAIHRPFWPCGVVIPVPPRLVQMTRCYCTASSSAIHHHENLRGGKPMSHFMSHVPGYIASLVLLT